MRMVEGRIGAHAHEFLHADGDRRMPGVVLEVGIVRLPWLSPVAVSAYIRHFPPRQSLCLRGNSSCRKPMAHASRIAGAGLLSAGCMKGKRHDGNCGPQQKEFIAEAAVEGDGRVTGNPDRFVNREFSWLQLTPRSGRIRQTRIIRCWSGVRFLSISAAISTSSSWSAWRASPVRCARASPCAVGGRTPEQQLEQILVEAAGCRRTAEEPRGAGVLLKGEGIESVQTGELTKDDKTWLDDHFMQQIFPVADAAVDRSGPPFPLHSQSRASRSRSSCGTAGTRRR